MDLYPFQRDAVEFLGMDGGIYADPPGTGKTPTTLRWLQQRWEPGEGILIVVPKVQLQHWYRQAELWFPELTVVQLVGSKARRQAELDRAGRLSGEHTPTALLVTYEVLRNDADLIAPFIKGGIIVCDEAHRLKNRSALVTKAMTKLARSAATITHLTGTPIMNGAEEVWSLLRMLDPQRYRSFWSWAHYYFEVEVTTFGYRQSRPVTIIHGVKPERLEELKAELAEYMIRRPLADLIDLPPVTHNPVPVLLSTKERKAYNQMRDHAWMEIDGEIIQGENEVAKNVRLRQLASEWGVFQDEMELGSKGAAAVDLVNDLTAQGEQVVVLCAFKATANKIAASLTASKHTRIYTGDTITSAREDILVKFSTQELDVVVGTLATMGEGVDGLQVARHLVLVDRDWTPARNDQAIGRLLRKGQERPITVHHIFAEDTIDQDVAETCMRKTTIITDTIGAS